MNRKTMDNTIYRSRKKGYHINRRERTITRPGGELTATMVEYERILAQFGYNVQLKIFGENANNHKHPGP
jgi:hypothetical protein